MTRADTHAPPASRDRQIHNGGCCHVIRAKQMRRAVFCIELQVTEATLAHVSANRFARVILCVVVVNREAHADIQVITEAKRKVEVTGQSAVNAALFHTGIPHIEFLGTTILVRKQGATGVAPVIGRNCTARP